MYFKIFNIIVILAFFGWIGHSMLMIAKLFSTIQCTDKDKVCYRSLLSNKPRLQLALFTSSTPNPIAAEITKWDNIDDFDYSQSFQKDYDFRVPLKTKRNGTMYLHVILAESGASLEWNTLRRDGPTVVHTMRITEYIEPKAQSFNLLKSKMAESSKNAKPTNSIVKKPITHLMRHVYVALLVEDFALSVQDVPPEMSQLIRVNHGKQIMPIMKTDFFKTRLNDLELVNRNMTKFTITFHYNTIGIGKLRLMIILEQAMRKLEEMGFGKNNIEDVKALMSDTNLYLLLLTISVASIHMLFDFLSLKNDVCFWRQKETYEGLSTRTTLWRAFSQIVIFLYLMEENTSVLVLVPAGLSTLIEIWKCKKILKLNISLSGGIRRRSSIANTRSSRKHSSDEAKTEEFDKQGMCYLSYLLYPLCISGAIYSLIYQPHRSWYSWTLHSMVNGVYAFGFLFMLPQLFVNYKLKSVAALPWRAFMYKAFNTFIDDFFAFIITMPTAHRVACLRDDVVFIIYLYQRWLYPVDKNRLDTDANAAIPPYDDAGSAEMLDVNRVEILKSTKQKKIN